jgi:hypothetical protein
MIRRLRWVVAGSIAVAGSWWMFVGSGIGARSGGHTYVLKSGDQVTIPSTHLTCVYSEDSTNDPLLCRDRPGPGRPGSLDVEITDVFVYVWTFNNDGSERGVATCLREPRYPKQRRHPCLYEA